MSNNKILANRELILFLAAYSLKCGFYAKAILYSKLGMALFPDDRHYREMCAYGFLLSGRDEELDRMLETIDCEAGNGAFLRARLIILQGGASENAAPWLRAYLKAFQKE